jgi:hypothetical protein
MKNESEEWRELCELVANETDPQKLTKYLDRLIRALDARKKALSAREESASGFAEGE